MVLNPSDLMQLRTIPAGDMGSVRDVAEMRDGDIVIAASKRLFHAKISQCGEDCALTQRAINFVYVLMKYSHYRNMTTL